MTEVSYGDYWKEVEDLAKQVADECREHGTDRDDVLHETIDGHEWVIYHGKALCNVLAHTTSDDAAFDEMGDDVLHDCASAGEVYSRLAFFALRADVAEKLADIPEDADEDEDAEPASAEGGAS